MRTSRRQASDLQQPVDRWKVLRRSTAAATATVVVGILTGCYTVPTQTPTEISDASPIQSESPPPATEPANQVPEYVAGAQAAATLALIDAAAPVPEYRRDTFGSGWSDVDGNGCAQRQDVLARDLVDTTVDVDCTVLAGTLHDPYTATTVDFAHDRIGGDSQAVQVDHIVSLSAAHAGGAWSWTDEQRLSFANDLDVLVAVDGPTNAAKGDRGPSDWMPPNAAYGCVYVLDYTTIAADFDVAVTSADRDTLVATLTGCAS